MGRGSALTDIFDTLNAKRGQLVLRDPEPAQSGAGSGSPFYRYVDTLVPGDGATDPYGRELLLAAVGCLLTLAAGLAVAMLPSGDTVRGSGFYWLGDVTTGNALDMAAGFAAPLLVAGAVLLAATGVLALVRPAEDVAHLFCGVQPIIGVLVLIGAAVAWAGFLLVFAINLLGWLALIVGAIFFGTALLIGALQSAFE